MHLSLPAGSKNDDGHGSSLSPARGFTCSFISAAQAPAVSGNEGSERCHNWGWGMWVRPWPCLPHPRSLSCTLPRLSFCGRVDGVGGGVCLPPRPWAPLGQEPSQGRDHVLTFVVEAASRLPPSAVSSPCELQPLRHLHSALSSSRVNNNKSIGRQGPHHKG